MKTRSWVWLAQQDGEVRKVVLPIRHYFWELYAYQCAYTWWRTTDKNIVIKGC